MGGSRRRTVAAILATALVFCAFAESAGAALVARGGRVAFNDAVHNRARVYSRNLSGTSVNELTTSSLPSTNPTYSPDGSTIVYTQFLRKDGGDAGTPDQLDLWAMNADGSNKHPLTSTNLINEDEAAFSLDGSQIAYTRSGNDGPDSWGSSIWVMNSDGSNQHVVTDDPGLNEQMSAFSPDGTHIAFVAQSATSNAGGISVVDLTTGDLTVLSHITGDQFPGPLFDMWPSYSPDGTLIAWTQFSFLPQGGVGQIYVVSPDGTDPHPITDLPINAQEPVWSTTGDELLFDAFEGAFSAIPGADPAPGPFLYSVKPDGSDAHPLNDSLISSYPDLQRRLLRTSKGCGGPGHAIAGASGPNLLRGTARSDFIDAKGGNDRIRGMQGNDTLCAGPGNDTVDGGPQGDTVTGDTGHDLLYGGAGDDRIDARDGEVDRIDCGPGTDIATLDTVDVITDATAQHPKGSCEAVRRG